MEFLVNKNDFLVFAEEENNISIINSLESSWSILIVDDDDEVHTVTKLALHDFTFDNKSLNLVSAYSEKEAKELVINYITLNFTYFNY